MKDLIKYAKFINPSFMGLLLLFFLLPFINIKCADQKIAQMTGIKLMTGGKVELTGTMGNLQKLGGESNSNVENNAKPNAFVIVAFALLLIGAVLNVVLKENKELITIILCGLVFIALLALQFTFQIPDNRGSGDMANLAGMITVNFDIGYWLVLIGVILVEAFNVLLFIQSKKMQQEAVLAENQPTNEEQH